MDARRHLSPQQFAGQAVSDRDELDGPLGSYGEPGSAIWQNSGVAADAGSGI